MPLNSLGALVSSRSRTLGGGGASARLPHPLGRLSPAVGCASDPVPELPSRIAEVPDPGQVVRSMLEMDALEVIEDRSPSLESGHRPLSPDLVGPPDRFQDGNSDFGYCFHQGGGFS